MHNFFTICKLLLKSKIKLKDPNKYKIVVYDDVEIGNFNQILKNYDYFTLKTRVQNIDEIYITPNIIKRFIKNFNGNLMTSYLTSLIEVINPKIVITFIDNSFKFSEIAKKLHNKIHFLAIQNAYRIDIGEYKHRYKKKLTVTDYRKRIFLPNFLCFGQFDIDLYKKHKINVKKFFIVGSLRLANFFDHLTKKKINLKKSKYDICLISESSIGRNKLFGIKNFEEKSALVVKYTIQFCMKFNMRFIYPLKFKDKKSELLYYKKYLTNLEYKYLKKNSVPKKNNFSTYSVMQQSKVSVAVITTLLSEQLATGRKILACNLTPTKLWDFPVNGICFIKNCDYKLFEKRLLKIYSISEKNYFSKLKKDKNYLVSFEKNLSTNKKIREKLDYFLNL
jgi:surface carbohydrate biosynthesis protein